MALSSSSICLLSSLADVSGGSTLSKYKYHSLESGFAVRQFSPNLKAESPTPKSRVVDREVSRAFSGGSKTVDHSHRLGGGVFQMGSKSPASSFRSLRLDGNRYRREGKQPLQALSTVGGSESAAPPSRFKDHVDSLLLRSRQVARALEADERSCEIISGLNRVGEKGEPILVGVVEGAENRGKGKAKVTVTESESGDSGEEEKRHDCIFCAGMPDLHGDKEAGKGEEIGESPALLAAKVKKVVGDLFEAGPGPFIPGVGTAKGAINGTVGLADGLGQLSCLGAAADGPTNERCNWVRRGEGQGQRLWRLMEEEWRKNPRIGRKKL
ncbi:hypothetical protein COLO4_20371 [Corchorus olitorius]|uniref:Uncharacterized protein n=1 Tax=Corchorus olitorius TaxID=93759 RepID=A0A1R3J046_9ROSI|nr:hypothetical protein COLO4_20371 [Corchorus olitorius]